MTKKWGYALVALGSFALGGAILGTGGSYISYKKGYERGYDEGYNKSEPEILVLNQKTHGIEGLCVVKNAKEMVCAADIDYNGSVDVVLIDVETQQIKDVIPGKDDCTSKYLQKLEEGLQKQEQQPKQQTPL